MLSILKEIALSNIVKNDHKLELYDFKYCNEHMRIESRYKHSYVNMSGNYIWSSEGYMDQYIVNGKLVYDDNKISPKYCKNITRDMLNRLINYDIRWNNYLKKEKKYHLIGIK
jgi:hypothetical protein